MSQQPIQKYQVETDIPFKKNAVINGDFNIWQRQTTFTSIGNNEYSTDRWIAGFSVTASRYTITRSTDVPTVAQANKLFNFSALCTVSIADATVGATDANVPLQQRIEGFNFLPLAQRPMILSFWVKSSLTGTYCVGLRNSVFDRSFVGEYTINLANTWEYKTISILASPSAGTWNYTNGHGIDINFTLMAGTSFQTTPNVWQTGNVFVTSNQVNHAATVGNTFRITGVQLESGIAVTEIEQRPIGEELALCQRYFSKSYDLSIVPGTITNAGAQTAVSASTSVGGATITVKFPQRMRDIPAVDVFNPTTGALGSLRRADSTNISGEAVGIGETSTNIRNAVATLDGFGHNSHYTADAEL